MKNYNNARVKQSLFAVDAMTLVHGDIRDDCLVKNQIHHGLTDLFNRTKRNPRMWRLQILSLSS